MITGQWLPGRVVIIDVVTRAGAPGRAGSLRGASAGAGLAAVTGRA